VFGDLAKAVRTESAAAVMYWWGVCMQAVWRWRRALGVTRTNNEGTHRLVEANATAGAAGKARGVTPAERRKRRRTALRDGYARRLRPGYHGPLWTAAQLRLLGTMPDEDVAKKIGRTPNAVRQRRTKLGIPTFEDRRKG
jgi:hypothetical protein